MKRILVALMILLAMQAARAETDLLVLGHSWHFGPNSQGLNGDNYGLGLEYRSERGWFAGGLTYRDSYRNQAYAGYVGYQYDVPIKNGWTAFGAIRAGYINGSGFHGIMAFPTVGVQYKRVAVEVLYIPRVGGNTTNVVGVFGRIRF
jgi:hypothetical protein